MSDGAGGPQAANDDPDRCWRGLRRPPGRHLGPPRALGRAAGMGDPMVQACLNGVRPPDTHPTLPVTPHQLARDARAVAELGVRSVHVHPRCGRGHETSHPGHVADTVAAIHTAAPGIEVVVPAARWVTPDPHHRADTLHHWGQLPPPARPDTIAVSVGDHGWHQICAAAHTHDIGVELGIWTPADTITLHRTGLPPGVRRLVAEITVGDPTLALTEADRLLRALHPLRTPILLHGEDAAAWPIWAYATQHGLHTRIGLEDTLTTPDDTPTRSNPDLVTHALRAQPRPRTDDRCPPSEPRLCLTPQTSSRWSEPVMPRRNDLTARASVGG